MRITINNHSGGNLYENMDHTRFLLKNAIETERIFLYNREYTNTERVFLSVPFIRKGVEENGGLQPSAGSANIMHRY